MAGETVLGEVLHQEALRLGLDQEPEIRRALRICGYNVARAAERLQLGQATLYRKVKKYDIHLDRSATEAATR